jgi:hypothetical protein
MVASSFFQAGAPSGRQTATARSTRLLTVVDDASGDRRTGIDKTDHYPRIFPLPDGRLIISGDGSGDGEPLSRNTYVMTIKPRRDDGGPPEVSFELGPLRAGVRRRYGTALMDPNVPQDFLLIGGMLGTELLTIGPGYPSKHVGAITATMERFVAPTPEHPNGTWELTPNFLGERQEDTRIRDPATNVFTFVAEGTYAIQGEIFLSEIFSPPYLFASGPRPRITANPSAIAYGQEGQLEIENATASASLVLIKLGSTTHGWDSGQRLVDLQFEQRLASGTVVFTVPSNRHVAPPGYYMLFYVNNVGKPSVAQIVRLH